MSNEYSKSDQSFLRTYNMKKVRSILRDEGFCSRVDLSSKANLDKKTITNIIDSFAKAEESKAMYILEVAKEVMEEIVSCENIEFIDEIKAGCTDMGDISAVMPAIHPYTAGATGRTHGNNYYINNPEEACINPTKMIMGMISLLLSNNAERAKEIIDKQEVRYSSKTAYFDAINKFVVDKEMLNYTEDGSIKLL
jgi:metal-dependent amidase/aminoacylase/carboxypeptidase family protein